MAETLAFLPLVINLSIKLGIFIAEIQNVSDDFTVIVSHFRHSQNILLDIRKTFEENDSMPSDLAEEYKRKLLIAFNELESFCAEIREIKSRLYDKKSSMITKVWQKSTLAHGELTHIIHRLQLFNQNMTNMQQTLTNRILTRMLGVLNKVDKKTTEVQRSVKYDMHTKYGPAALRIIQGDIWDDEPDGGSSTQTPPVQANPPPPYCQPSNPQSQTSPPAMPPVLKPPQPVETHPPSQYSHPGSPQYQTNNPPAVQNTSQPLQARPPSLYTPPGYSHFPIPPPPPGPPPQNPSQLLQSRPASLYTPPGSSQYKPPPHAAQNPSHVQARPTSLYSLPGNSHYQIPPPPPPQHVQPQLPMTPQTPSNTGTSHRPYNPSSYAPSSNGYGFPQSSPSISSNFPSAHLSQTVQTPLSPPYVDSPTSMYHNSPAYYSNAPNQFTLHSANTWPGHGQNQQPPVELPSLGWGILVTFARSQRVVFCGCSSARAVYVDINFFEYRIHD